MPRVRSLPTTLPGVIVIEPALHGDSRGFFQETYRQSVFAALGITDQFVQDNHSRSSRGVIRGLHAQGGAHAQAKLIRRWSKGALLGLTIHEGRHHQVKRMCGQVGLRVEELSRIQVGPLDLRGLRPGR